jgi:hypothetical protein
VVVPGALDPYSCSTWPLLGRAYRPLDYFKEMMDQIDDLDGIALHAYTQWLDPKLITSLQTFTDDPLVPNTPHEHYYQFQAYRAFAEAIPARWRDRPTSVAFAAQRAAIISLIDMQPRVIYNLQGPGFITPTPPRSYSP